MPPAPRSRRSSPRRARSIGVRVVEHVGELGDRSRGARPACATASPSTTLHRVVVRMPEDDRRRQRHDREPVGQHLGAGPRVREGQPGRDHDVRAVLLDHPDHLVGVAGPRRPGLARVPRRPAATAARQSAAVRAEHDRRLRERRQRHPSGLLEAGADLRRRAPRGPRAAGTPPRPRSAGRPRGRRGRSRRRRRAARARVLSVVALISRLSVLTVTRKPSW